jgi:hypothetical protein
MTDETANLVLEHLRAIRGEMGAMKDEMRTMKSELPVVRHVLDAHTVLLNQCVEDITTVRVRLDRIERRLDLVDAK